MIVYKKRCMCIFNALIKSSSYDCWGAEYLVCQIPIEMLKLNAIPNSSLHKLKSYSWKGCRKTSQRCRWIRYLANTAILNILFCSRRYHFRLWVFASTGEYFYCWHWRVLHNVLQSKYDAKTFKNIVYMLFYALNSQIIICKYCILQIGSFN